MALKGWIHSLESMGLVDGPGIRSVAFLQGCPLRCLYCHNPDAQDFSGGKSYTPQELVNWFLRFRPYYERSGGGVTFSGGEPLQQPEFLIQCLRLLRQEGIHTCIDTSGVGKGCYEEILSHTDLVLYDVKHPVAEEYRRITGLSPEPTRIFLEKAQEMGVPLWIRHVVVPGLTDSLEHLESLRDFVAGIRHVQRVELLPFHKLGAHKYKLLGRQDPLEQVPAMDRDLCAKLQERFFPQGKNQSNKV